MKVGTGLGILAGVLFLLGFGLFAFEDRRDEAFETMIRRVANDECIPAMTATKPCVTINNMGNVQQVCGHNIGETK